MESSEKRTVKHIAILGANGQIGKAVTDQLFATYPNARISACARSHMSSSIHTGIHYLQFNPFADNWKLLGKVDVLINCIGIIEESKEISFEKAHLGLTQLMLAHRKQMGFPRIIQISALGAHPEQASPFLQTKGKADDLLLQEANTVIVRPSIVCTPDTVFLQKLKMLRNISRKFFHLLPFPGHVLQTKIQPVMAEDVASLVTSLCTAIAHPRMVYAAGPDIFSMKKLIQLADPKTRLIPIPKPVFNSIFHTISQFISGIINPAQYQLITSDNTADGTIAEKLIGRHFLSTTDFWTSELKQ